MADAGRVIAGTRPRHTPRRRRTGDAAADRPRQGGALRHARSEGVRALDRAVPRPLRRQWRGRHRGAQPRRDRAPLSSSATAAVSRHRRQPAPRAPWRAAHVVRADVVSFLSAARQTARRRSARCSSTRPTASELLERTLELLGDPRAAGWPTRPSWWPSTSGATRRRSTSARLARYRERPLRRDDADLLPAMRHDHALYPGSFDPITFGHLDVVGRAAGGLRPARRRRPGEPKKSPLCSLDERIEAIREAVDEELPAHGRASRGRRLRRPDGRLRAQVGAGFIVRGLRAVSDFESELQMAHTNRKLAPEVDTVFFMTALEHAYLSLEPGQGDRRVRRRREPDGARCVVTPAELGRTGVRPYNGVGRLNGGGHSHRHHLPHRTARDG